MTKKPKIVKEEDLIKRKDGLYYKKYARVPFTGAAKDFYENGQLKGSDNYKEGEKHGPSESYYENRQVRWKENFKNGKLHGLCEYFDEDGKLTKTESWENGKLVK